MPTRRLKTVFSTRQDIISITGMGFAVQRKCSGNLLSEKDSSSTYRSHQNKP